MKKTLLKSMVGILAVAGLVILGQNLVHAGITGNVCSTCHTMHNSQDGGNMNGTSTANETLLIDTCLGCHSVTDGTSMTHDPIGAPVVYHNTGSAPTKTLAGGDFWYVINAGYGDGYGHNPDVVNDEKGGVTDPLDQEPPGNAGTIFTTDSSHLGCIDGGGAVVGCHEIGGHHTNNAGAGNTTTVYWADGTSIGTSYRFLRKPTGASGWIKGGEAGDWEYTDNISTSHHNVYWAGTGSDFTDKQTLSVLCAECHGNFHGTAATTNVSNSGYDNPWVRHPTDYPLNASSNTAYTNYGSYDATVPIGTADSTIATQVSGGVLDMTRYDGYDATYMNMVVCVSCHRAHGSANDVMLRWDYSTMEAGSSTHNDEGCFKCHSDKDSTP